MKRKHIAEKAAAQRLRCAGDAGAMDRILQEECRRKASRKLPVTLLCGDFRFPTALSAEQCTSDEVAALHARMIEPGAHVLDLTAGLGIDAFHMARKAASVTAIDINPDVAAMLPLNAAALGIDNLTAECAECGKWLEDNSGSRRFDVAFIDPARRAADGSRVYSLADCSPDVVKLMPLISGVAARLIVKASPMLDITALLRDEGLRPRSVTVIGTRDECKELVLDFRFGHEPESIEIKAVTAGGGEFAYGWMAPRPLVPAIEPEELAPGMLIGFPWPAMVKSGACDHMALRRLHPAVSLFAVDDDGIADFPGEVYRVTRVEPFSSSMIKQLKRHEDISASVTVRNFPVTAEQLRLRLGARENSACRLLGTTVGASRFLVWLVR